MDRAWALGGADGRLLIQGPGGFKRETKHRVRPDSGLSDSRTNVNGDSPNHLQDDKRLSASLECPLYSLVPVSLLTGARGWLRKP